MQPTATQTSSKHPDGSNLLCRCRDCQPGQRQKLGLIYEQQGIVLADRRHGTLHRAEVGVKELLMRLAGTIDGSAVVNYVEEVMG